MPQSLRVRADEILNRVVASVITAGVLAFLAVVGGIIIIVGIALWARVSDLSAPVVTALALASAALVVALLTLALAIRSVWTLRRLEGGDGFLPAYADEHGYFPLGNGFSVRAHKGNRDRDSEDRWNIELALAVRNDQKEGAQDAELRLVRVDVLRSMPDGPAYKPLENLRPARFEWSAGDGGGTKCSFQHEATATVADLKTWGDSNGAYSQLRPADHSLWEVYRVNHSTLHLVIDVSAEARDVARFVVAVHVETRFRGKDEPTVYFHCDSGYTESERNGPS